MNLPPADDWKEKRRKELAERQEFFGNSRKWDREKWIAERFIRALAIDFQDAELKLAAEPVDVAFRDARFQTKELPEENRKRGDEIKESLEIAKAANDGADLLEPYNPINISFTDVVRLCYAYVDELKTKYGPHERKNMDMLIYFNWVNHQIVPPTEVPATHVAFRSLSVVSNIYCAIAFASEDAPTFLKTDARRAIQYIEA